MFATGDHVVQRNIELGRVRFAVASVVVSDNTRETRLFRPCGAAITATRSFALRADAAAYEAATQRELLQQRWSYIDAAWEVTDALVLRAGRSGTRSGSSGAPVAATSSAST